MILGFRVRGAGALLSQNCGILLLVCRASCSSWYICIWKWSTMWLLMRMNMEMEYQRGRFYLCSIRELHVLHCNSTGHSQTTLY